MTEAGHHPGRALFWNIRRFIEVRNPELLEEYTGLYQKGSLVAVCEFLDTHYPHPEHIEWAAGPDILEVVPELNKHYPNGKVKS